ncbi:MAG: nucleotidyltransferase domain-containing protein [Acidobacteria bacterium]|nr:nucleotidyltransferase domain-containing protein [Acidobacteriota bacterium]
MTSTREIQSLCDQIVERFHPEKIVLFGSHAYGQPRWDSDVDLLVVMPFEGHPLLKAAEILTQVNPSIAVDLLVRTPQQIQARLSIGDRFVEEIVSQGKVLHEAHNHRMD